MTALVDKLEKELARNCRLNNWDLGFKAAINIVKQHSDWQNLSSDTQLQNNQTCILIMQNDSDEYPVIYDVGLYRKNENSTAWLSLTKTESYIDESKILALQLIEPPLSRSSSLSTLLIASKIKKSKSISPIHSPAMR